jgi:uncharacterized protein (DUF305 family)
MRVRATLVLFVVVLLLMAPSVMADSGGLDPAPDARVAELEKEFIMGMIQHHRGAIMMAEMAVMKAAQPELRELAEKIISDQKGEIEELSHYLRDWYGMQPPAGNMMSMDMMMKMDMPMMHAMMPNEMARMQALEAKTGADFDIEFMSAMTDHHAMAIMMSAPILINGHHTDLMEVAETIISSQVEEIHQMRDWLKDWYGVERPL